MKIYLLLCNAVYLLASIPYWFLSSLTRVSHNVGHSRLPFSDTFVCFQYVGSNFLKMEIISGESSRITVYHLFYFFDFLLNRLLYTPVRNFSFFFNTGSFFFFLFVYFILLLSFLFSIFTGYFLFSFACVSILG